LNWTTTESDQEWQARLVLMDEAAARRDAERARQAEAKRVREEAKRAQEEAKARVLYETLKQRFEPQA
jgi:hypothetical protein